MAAGGGDALAWERLRERFSDGFFPLETSTTTPDGVMLMEVVTLERMSLSDDLFRIDGGREDRLR